tara:strand:- start:75 stop:2189 length:2115 start_codon:yes stop_codon:yes gene_type:complete
MKLNVLFFFFLLLSIVSCGQTIKDKKNIMGKEHKYTNELINESSPYLLQHAHNPVNWYPWGEKALQKAKDENKLLIISVGYAACHWCHVMEQESFENEKVAEIMNDNFICIKVDREERPDIDQIYMNAVQLISGRGGWPLNCFALPDGRPIYGGTYFPVNNWMNVMNKIYDLYHDSKKELEKQATELTSGIQSSELVQFNKDTANFLSLDLNRTYTNFEKYIDQKEGGSKGAPKFPMPVGYDFLLHYHYFFKEKEALDAVELTLVKMAYGGIYDQIGGGFARYSTDSYWKVPHFEKMLYDNGQLVSLYASAYQLTKNPIYKTVVEETLGFVQRELTSKEGGFYSSLDADSEGVEGKFYVWKEDEVRNVLVQDADLIIDYYNVSGDGFWEHGVNILLKNETDESFAKRNGLSIKELEKKIKVAKQVLLKERENRIRPGLDDKILTSWNGLMLKGYVDAYKVLGDKSYLNTALKNADFIIENLMESDNRLNRNYKNSTATINAFLDDYAFTISAFISLYQATFDNQWLNKAEDLLVYAKNHFYDEKSGMFYYTSDKDPALIARKMEVSDNVIPSSNSEMAKNLFLLGRYSYNEKYLAMSKTMLNNVKESAINGASYFGNWAVLMSWFSGQTYDVSIVGNDCEKIRKQINDYYLPNIFLSGGKKENGNPLLEGKLVPNKTMIYVCQNKSCKLPVSNVKDMLLQIKNL